MTPEQVTKRMGRMYALIGAGIACLIMAYQYAQPTVGIAEPPPEWAPYMFGIIGIVCLIVGGGMALQLKKEPAPPATTDLKSPQGKVALLWLGIGVAALAGSYLVDFLVQDENVRLLLSVGLLVVMIVCFFTAARIARKLRTETAAGAAKE
ncbi:MAG TPA: hypothetical protein VGF02_03375 [Pseudolabrys sp.]|jgi:hypothetical protein